MKASSFTFLAILSSIVYLCCNNNEATISPNENDPITNPDTIENSKDTLFSYLALGDSYTIGQSVNENERWPQILKQRLAISNRNITTLKIIAQTGWTTSDLIQSIKEVDPAKQEMISLLIGVNNQFQGLKFETFTEEFDSLITIANNLTTQPSRLFVVSIPDYGVTPFGQSNSDSIGAALDRYNDYMHDKCTLENIPFINITELSRSLEDDLNALASDNLHPSGYQYNLWVDNIIYTASQVMEN